jgi:hypothetical protein
MSLQEGKLVISINNSRVDGRREELLMVFWWDQEGCKDQWSDD